MRTLPILLLLATCSSLALSAQKKVDLKALDAYTAKAVTDLGQPGLAVGIVKDGQLIWSKGYGKLDVTKSDPVTANSIFFIASMSKAFTACAIGLLVDEGKLSFDDPVRKHLPWFKTPDDYVTEHMLVRDLLCHRSGWITFDGDLLWYGTTMSQREILDRHASEPFTHGFREDFGYSNLMFIAAAQVIEAVSGITWDQFLTTRILQPLGMTRSTVETAALASMTDVAMPHLHPNQDPNAPLISMPYQPLQGADGACGVNSCVTDLAKWDAMWMNEGKVGDKEFLKPGTWTTITTPHLSNELGPQANLRGRHFRGTALGWFTYDAYGSKIITHSGGMPGFILNHAVVPEKDLAVICLGNGETSTVFAITNKVLDLYLGDGKLDPAVQSLQGDEAGRTENAERVAKREAARIKNTSPSLPLVAFSGTYTDKIYGDARIDLEPVPAAAGEGLLILSFAAAPELFTGPLEHWHHDTWRWSHGDPFLEAGYITFSFDADHKVTGFKIELYSPDFHFWKLDLKRQ